MLGLMLQTQATTIELRLELPAALVTKPRSHEISERNLRRCMPRALRPDERVAQQTAASGVEVETIETPSRLAKNSNSVQNSELYLAQPPSPANAVLLSVSEVASPPSSLAGCACPSSPSSLNAYQQKGWHDLHCAGWEPIPRSCR